jgi:undecaprenyl-diphosphatase
MSIIEALILGVVQGITEFLPVSSSGHLVLLQQIFGVSGSVLLFDTMVHVGTLAAVCIVLWRESWGILRRPVQALTGFLIMGTIPTVIIALVLKDTIEKAFHSAAYLGFAFLFTALVLLVCELLARRAGRLRPPGSMRPFGPRAHGRWLYDAAPGGLCMGWLDALIIGIFQAIAIVPGVSRSGMTLSGAISRKLDRNFAARFSFLLSIPAILGALVLQIKDIADGESLGNIGAAPLVAGTLAAAVVGFFAVKLMLKIVRERSLRGFAVYVAILGVLVLIDQNITHLFFGF